MEERAPYLVGTSLGYVGVSGGGGRSRLTDHSEACRRCYSETEPSAKKSPDRPERWRRTRCNASCCATAQTPWGNGHVYVRERCDPKEDAGTEMLVLAGGLVTAPLLHRQSPTNRMIRRPWTSGMIPCWTLSNLITVKPHYCQTSSRLIVGETSLIRIAIRNYHFGCISRGAKQAQLRQQASSNKASYPSCKNRKE